MYAHNALIRNDILRAEIRRVSRTVKYITFRSVCKAKHVKIHNILTHSCKLRQLSVSDFHRLPGQLLFRRNGLYF